MSASSEAALKHLKKVKPLDGFSVETSKDGVRLLRRNVPLSQNFYQDLYHDVGRSGAVVGILSRTGSGRASAQVLVNKEGTPVRGTPTVVVQGWKGIVAPSSAAPNVPASDANPVPVLSDEQNMQLIKFGAMGIGGILLLKLVVKAALLLYILALPILYLYLVQNCPTDASFEVKRELKRVMRGSHLPDDHPDKPKGFLSETLARLQASVTAEVATGLGYEVTIVSLAGAAKVVCVRVPAAKMDYYWVGVLHRWYYVYSTELVTPDE